MSITLKDAVKHFEGLWMYSEAVCLTCKEINGTFHWSFYKEPQQPKPNVFMCTKKEFISEVRKKPYQFDAHISKHHKIDE